MSLRMIRLALCLILVGQGLSATGYSQQLDPWLSENARRLGKIYLNFHRNPELSFQEEKTAERFASLLRDVGAKVTTNVGGFGVVAFIENGDGPTVMLRTDLDALPVTEQTNLPYASDRKTTDENGNEVGLMHACGHDMHMTCVAGATQYLANHKDRWSGRLMVIGQPAEERGAGARAMLDDGLFEKFARPDYAIALHCRADLPTGSISMRGGYAMANVDSVDIEVFGRGGHGAYPHTTIDPIVQAAKLVLDIQTIVSREIRPIEPAVITVGSIHGGTKHNIIADSCHLQLTVRSYSDEVREQLIAAIRRKAKAAAASVQAKEPVVTVSEGTPSLSNDPELSERIFELFQTRFGNEQIVEAEPSMGGEDFSHYGREGVPSLMYSLGVVDQARLDRYVKLGTPPPSLHSPLFYCDIDRSIFTGVKSLAISAIELMPVAGEGNSEDAQIPRQHEN